jgi:ApbE superfamily uncharacterized protein (UPF0280 family)
MECPSKHIDEPRKYRRRVRSPDLKTFRVTLKETDLLVSAETDLSQEVLAAVRKYRGQIEAYIDVAPEFKHAWSPLAVAPTAPPIIQEMAGAARAAGVGPMAAVAGSMAEFVARDMLGISPQIIVENGGDIFLVANTTRKMSIFTEARTLPHFIEVLIPPEKTPVGICTSSGNEGPSLSLGCADAVTVIASSAALADAVATAAGNLIRSQDDIERAIDFVRVVPGVRGAAVLVNERLGFWGDLELCDYPS